LFRPSLIPFFPDKQNAGIILRSQDCCPFFSARHADSEVLTRLVIDLRARITPHDPVDIRYDLPLGDPRPPFDDDHFVELLALGLVRPKGAIMAIAARATVVQGLPIRLGLNAITAILACWTGRAGSSSTSSPLTRGRPDKRRRETGD
jgi:hypothetical protein